MKSPHNGSDGNPPEPEDDDLPVFESLDAPTHAGGEVPGAVEEEAAPGAYEEEPTDFESLMRGGLAERPPQREEAPTDFTSLNAELDEGIRAFERRRFSDYFVAFLSPFMIFIMVVVVINFLLDIRYIFDARHSFYLRIAAFSFIVGIVALNRLVARDGKDESIIYMLVFAAVVGLFTVSLHAYDAGSLSAGLIGGPGEFLLNMAIVAFTWWMTNRLTHECCVDSHPEAGDVGILTGTARRLRELTARQEQPKRYSDLYEPVDPTEWKKPEKKRPRAPLAASERLSKRHPGVSIFIFSVPVMIVFAWGLRYTQHGGSRMVLIGHFYLGCYTVAALMLLMLTSLAQLREYFRARRTKLPRGLSLFWISLGTVMVVMVLFGATALPMPDLPPVAYVAKHIYDPWVRGPTFQPLSVAATPVEIMEQTRLTERVGQVVLLILGLFVAYGVLRGVGAVAFSIARRRDRHPRFVVRFFDWLDRLLTRIAALPKLPSWKRSIRISPDVSTARDYLNPLGDASRSARMTTADQIDYAYDALCALAYDLGVPRRPDQTPYEFLESFPEQLTGLKEEAIELTNLLVLSSYAGRRFDERVLDRLRKFWLHYEKMRARVVR